jgi:hypothetical protein
MNSIILCVLAFAASYYYARKSLAAGLGVLMAVGYAYGLVRANFLDGYSHLLFDCGLLGVYAARLTRAVSAAERLRLEGLRTWLYILVGWPLVLFLAPTQDLLIELVGLRGNAFMLPCLLLGARLSRDELYDLAVWLGVLNIIAGALALAEFIYGIEPFFPMNAVTEIIYRSGDVAQFTAHRIPSCFANAHAYGATMVMTLPILIGASMQPHARKWMGQLFTVAIAVSALGVFVAAARLPVVLLLAMTGVAMFSGRVRIGYRLRWVFVGLVVAYMVSGEERLQRFLTLSDTNFVAERIAGSVNVGILDLVRTYPLGNGLGGGGTSIPYFLQDRVRNVVMMESEYARIVLEQGIPGLVAWLAFIAWLLTRHVADNSPWDLSRKLMRVVGAGSFASGLLGIGLLTSIPMTPLLFMTMGWAAAEPRTELEPVAQAVPNPPLAYQYGRR